MVSGRRFERYRHTTDGIEGSIGSDPAQEDAAALMASSVQPIRVGQAGVSVGAGSQHRPAAESLISSFFGPDRPMDDGSPNPGEGSVSCWAAISRRMQSAMSAMSTMYVYIRLCTLCPRRPPCGTCSSSRRPSFAAFPPASEAGTSRLWSSSLSVSSSPPMPRRDPSPDRSSRSRVLGLIITDLVGLERVPGQRPARQRDPLGPQGIPLVLASHLEARARKASHIDGGASPWQNGVVERWGSNPSG